MRENYTDITFLLDRSGSMASVLAPTIEGYNAFLNDQREVQGEATASLYQFDDKYEPNYVGVPVKEAPALTTDTYRPRGWTYLYEAMGRAINETGARLEALPQNERPSKVVFVILTDGREQHSPGSERASQFTQQQVKQLVEQQIHQYNWQFIFIGANQNAILEAAKFGMMHVNSITYAPNVSGTASVFNSLSKNITKYRAGGQSAGFESEDYKAQEKAGVKNDQAHKATSATKKDCCRNV